MIAAGPPWAMRLRTTGSGASSRSPEKPAPQPTLTVPCFGTSSPSVVCVLAPQDGPARVALSAARLPQLTIVWQTDLSDRFIGFAYASGNSPVADLPYGGRSGQFQRGG